MSFVNASLTRGGHQAVDFVHLAQDIESLRSDGLRRIRVTPVYFTRTLARGRIRLNRRPRGGWKNRGVLALQKMPNALLGKPSACLVFAEKADRHVDGDDLSV